VNCKCAGKLRLSDVEFVPLIGLAIFVGCVTVAGVAGFIVIQGVKTLRQKARRRKV